MRVNPIMHAWILMVAVQLLMKGPPPSWVLDLVVVELG